MSQQQHSFWLGHCLPWPGGWVAAPPLWSVLNVNVNMLDVPDNVTGWVAFLREQLSVKTNWSQTVSKFHRLWTLLPLNVFSLPHGVGWRVRSSQQLEVQTVKQIGKAQFVIVNVVDKYEMCVCVPNKDSNSDVNFHETESLKSLCWIIDCLLWW